MDEQMIEQIARVLDPDAWRIADDNGPDGIQVALSYSMERARAAHSVIAGKVAELEAALKFYARENNWRSNTVYMCGHGDINCNVMGDKGVKARAALAPYPERR